jgi:glycosyltransferase involved in cell wall biosynthesis
MRVLFNTYPLAFDCPGGGEIQLLAYKTALEALGVEVILYDPWHPQFDEVDAVHYFSVQGGSITFCAHVKQRGIPLLLSPIIWLTEENIKVFPMEEIRNLLHVCDLVLPNSAAEVDQLANTFQVNREKFEVIYNGIGNTFIETASSDLFPKHFEIEHPYILNMANVEPRKNQLALIEAVTKLDMTLVLAGRVRDEAYFRQCMREGEGIVRYVGVLPHGSPLQKSAYRDCDVFALPSLLETPGLAALEAASQGARVVITSVGCTREYFLDMATYVNPHDTADIRTGITTALAKERDGSLKAHVLSHYTWDKSAEALRAAYARVCGQVLGRGVPE